MNGFNFTFKMLFRETKSLINIVICENLLEKKRKNDQPRNHRYIFLFVFSAVQSKPRSHIFSLSEVKNSKITMV